MPGIIAEGAAEYLRALEAQEREKLDALTEALRHEENVLRRSELEDELMRVRLEFAERRKRVASSLF
jgi:hypothetical protein